MDDKERVLQMCFKSLQVAQAQFEDLEKNLYELHSNLRPEYFARVDHPFLAIPEIEEEADLEALIRYLKKYDVTLRHMSSEYPLSEGFQECVKDANIKVLELTNWLKEALPVLRENLDLDTIDEGEPVFPEELKVESKLSARQSRDVIVVRNYNKLLNLSEDVLNRYV